MDVSNGSRARQAAGAKNGLKYNEGADAKEVPKESFTRKLLLAAHEQGRVAAEQEQLRNGKQEPLVSNVNVATAAVAEHAIPLSFSSLEQIFLPQLEIGKRHRGRCLSGTFCVRPFKVSSSVVMSVLADRSGKAVRVSIVSPRFSSASTQAVDALFASGRNAIIKEPYFTISPEDGKVMVLVENEEDLGLVDFVKKEIAIESQKEIVSESEALLQELDKIRAEGNQLFAQQKWKEAIEQYSRCIARGSAVSDGGGGDNVEKVNQCLLLAFSNRSQVWLQLLNFKNALDDANKALEIDPNHQKSISRRDKAWRGFGKVQFSSNKVKVPIEDTTIAPEPLPVVRAAEEEVASKSKSKDVTQPAKTTLSKVKPTKGNNAPSGGPAANGTGSKSVSPLRNASDSKDKKSASSLPTSKVKGAELSKNLSLARDKTSPVKATERKSIPPTPPKVSKVKPVEKPVESRDSNPAAPATPPTEEKLSIANPDQPSAAEGKLAVATSYEDNIAAAPAGDSFRQSSDSENDSDSDNDSSSPESSEITKRTNADGDDVQDEYTEIERKPTTNSARGDAALPSWFPSDLEVTVHSSTTDPQKEIMATGAIDNEVPSFAAWLDSIRSSADVLLSKGNWSDAVKYYNRVTGFSLPKRNRDQVIKTLLLAYSHRSEAWVWIGDFEKSLRDADSAMRIVDNCPTSVVGFEGKHFLNEVRRGRAFHGLGEYEKAIHVFKEALIKSPNDKSIIDFLKKSRVALEQSQKGIYDLDEFFVNGCRGPPPPCSDFVGPVEIRRVLGKGRGLFSTKDIEAGDLLLVSNPLVISHLTPNTQDEDYRHLTTLWRRNGDGSPVGLDDFVGKLSYLQTQKKILQLYSLTGGKPEDEIEVPDIDLFIPGNQFVAPRGWEGYAGDDGFGKLRHIAIRNAIDGGLNPLDGVNRNQGFGDDDEVAVSIVGLWALPSFMNHSCVPNCHMIDIGKAMFVRASRTIMKGEELTRAYFDVYQNGLDRQRLCEEWSFVCECERCILEKSLTAQRVLPLHEYRKLLERVREESAKRLHFADEKERSLSLLLPNPQPALLQLRKFADWFDGLLDRAEGLGNKEKAWIGASHLEAYISRFQGSKDRNQYILALEIILEFMTNTAILAIGQTTGSALARAATLLAQVEDMYGTGSQTYRRVETRVLELYHTAYGGLNKEVLFTMSRLMNSTRVR